MRRGYVHFRYTGDIQCGNECKKYTCTHRFEGQDFSHFAKPAQRERKRERKRERRRERKREREKEREGERERKRERERQKERGRKRERERFEHHFALIVINEAKVLLQ